MDMTARVTSREDRGDANALMQRMVLLRTRTAAVADALLLIAVACLMSDMRSKVKVSESDESSLQ